MVFRIKEVFILFVFLGLVFHPVPGFAKLEGENRTIVGGYDIDGYTISSFYPQGAFYRQELDLSLKEDLRENLKLDSFLSVRYTDDTYVDPETFSYETIKIKLTGEDFGVNLGDFYGKFSNYALNQALKGLDVDKDVNFMGEGNLEFVFGVTKDKWEGLWRKLDKESYTRYVTGASYKQTLNDRIKLRFDFVNTDDDDDGSAATSSTNPIENQLFAAKATLDLFEKYLKCDIQTAHSWHDSNTSSESVNGKDDYAVKVDTVLSINDIKVSNKYEKVGARFNSPVASVSADREEYNTKFKIKLADGRLKPELGYTVLQDNVDNSKTTTKFTSVPYVKVVLKPFSAQRHLQVEASYKERKVETTDGSTTDENTKTGYIGIKNRIGKTNFDFGYQHRRKIDDITVTDERDINKLMGGLKTTLKFENVRFWGIEKLTLRPDIRYEIEKDKQLSTKGSDTYQNTRFGLDASWDDSVLNLDYKLADTDMDAGGIDKVKTTIKMQFRHYLWGDKRKIFNFSFESRDYQKENATRSYTEDIYEAKYTYKF